MNQRVHECGRARRQRIALADAAVTRARTLSAKWRYPNGFANYMTAVRLNAQLIAAGSFYKKAGLTLLAERVERLRSSRDVPAAWQEFDRPEPTAGAAS
jgi:hypothetical protein